MSVLSRLVYGDPIQNFSKYIESGIKTFDGFISSLREEDKKSQRFMLAFQYNATFKDTSTHVKATLSRSFYENPANMAYGNYRTFPDPFNLQSLNNKLTVKVPVIKEINGLSLTKAQKNKIKELFLGSDEGLSCIIWKPSNDLQPGNIHKFSISLIKVFNPNDYADGNQLSIIIKNTVDLADKWREEIQRILYSKENGIVNSENISQAPYKVDENSSIFEEKSSAEQINIIYDPTKKFAEQTLDRIKKIQSIKIEPHGSFECKLRVGSTCFYAKNMYQTYSQKQHWKIIPWVTYELCHPASLKSKMIESAKFVQTIDFWNGSPFMRKDQNNGLEAIYDIYPKKLKELRVRVIENLHFDTVVAKFCTVGMGVPLEPDLPSIILHPQAVRSIPLNDTSEPATMIAALALSLLPTSKAPPQFESSTLETEIKLVEDEKCTLPSFMSSTLNSQIPTFIHALFEYSTEIIDKQKLLEDIPENWNFANFSIDANLGENTVITGSLECYRSSQGSKYLDRFSNSISIKQTLLGPINYGSFTEEEKITLQNFLDTFIRNQVDVSEDGKNPIISINILNADSDLSKQDFNQIVFVVSQVCGISNDRNEINSNDVVEKINYFEKQLSSIYQGLKGALPKRELEKPVQTEIKGEGISFIKEMDEALLIKKFNRMALNATSGVLSFKLTGEDTNLNLAYSQNSPTMCLTYTLINQLAFTGVDTSIQDNFRNYCQLKKLALINNTNTPAMVAYQTIRADLSAKEQSQKVTDFERQSKNIRFV